MRRTPSRGSPRGNLDGVAQVAHPPGDDLEFEAVRRTLDAQQAALEWDRAEWKRDDEDRSRRLRLKKQMLEAEAARNCYQERAHYTYREVLRPLNQQETVRVHSDSFQQSMPLNQERGRCARASERRADASDPRLVSSAQLALMQALASRDAELAEAISERDAAQRERDAMIRQYDAALEERRVLIEALEQGEHQCHRLDCTWP